MNRAFRLTTIVLIGIFVCYRVINSIDHTLVFDVILDDVFIAFSLILLLIIFLFDRKEYNRNCDRLAFLPTVSGLGIAILLLLLVFLFRLRDRSPSILYGVYNGDFNGMSIDFRKDNTYKVTDWCLGEDIYRGKYVKKDSILELDNQIFNTSIKSNRLIVSSNINYGDASGMNRLIFQLDKFGMRMENEIVLKVLE